MTSARRWTTFSKVSLAMTLLALPAMLPVQAHGQAAGQAATAVQVLELIAGRSFPITGTSPISKVTVANPAIADVVVISETEVVINAIMVGETDIILWGTNVARRHFRVAVRSSTERRQVLLSVKFAEVRRDALRQIGTSLVYMPEPGSTRIGTGVFNNDGRVGSDGKVSYGNGIKTSTDGNTTTQTESDGKLALPARFLTVLSTFNSRQLLGLLDLEEQRGNARSLAEPNLMAANREEASFLAGGEIPIPIIQGGQNNGVSVVYREFGIRLTFTAEVLSDSLIKLKVRPEVSQLDYGNAITLSGFRIPALRTRRMESTVDVLQNRSLIISGLFNEEREQVKTGLPFLSSIPILGDLFSSQRWLKSESELIVVVTPIIMDPNNPRAADLMRFAPDTTRPAGAAIEKRLPVKPPVKPPL